MISALRIPAQLLTVLFLAGSALLLFFIVLAGTKSDGNVLNKWYWLVADTSSFKNAQYPVSRWSLYGLCGYEKGSDVKHPGKFIGCTKNKADYPFDIKRNFDISEDQLEPQFQTNKWYYETRFQFPFYLIALFFDVLAMFTTLFSGLLRPIAFLTGAFILMTFLFSTIAASLSTAAYVSGRNALRNINVSAEIAPTLYGFAWAVVFMAFLNLIFACCITPNKNDQAGAYKPKKKGTPAGKRGGYRFGIGKKKTTEGGAENKDASSFVRA